MLDRIKYSLTAVIISFPARVGLLISCFVLFVVSLLSLMDRVEHCRSPCWLLCCSLVCHLCVVCLGLFTLPIIVIDRLISVNGGSTLTSVLLLSTLNHPNTDGSFTMANSNSRPYPVSILRKSISGRHRPVRVADGPMTARCRFR